MKRPGERGRIKRKCKGMGNPFIGNICIIFRLPLNNDLPSRVPFRIKVMPTKAFQTGAAVLMLRPSFDSQPADLRLEYYCNGKLVAVNEGKGKAYIPFMAFDSGTAPQLAPIVSGRQTSQLKISNGMYGTVPKGANTNGIGHNLDSSENEEKSSIPAASIDLAVSGHMTAAEGASGEKLTLPLDSKVAEPVDHNDLQSKSFIIIGRAILGGLFFF